MGMKAPTYLDKDAKSHWNRHQEHCTDNGSLTDETADSFALACRVWSILHNTNPIDDPKTWVKFINLAKMYCQVAKPFGLLGDKAPVAKGGKSIADIIQEGLADAE